MEIQLWKQTLRPYELAVNELTLKFNHIIKEYAQENVYSPIEQVTGRVKSVTSILEKAQKKNIPIDEIEEQIAAARRTYNANVTEYNNYVQISSSVLCPVTERAEPHGRRAHISTTILLPITNNKIFYK